MKRTYWVDLFHAFGGVSMCLLLGVVMLWWGLCLWAIIHVVRTYW